MASEEQMAEYFLEKIGFRFDRSANMVEIYGWNWSQPIGDIHLVSTKDAEKVRDACDALIRKAYGWPEAK